MFVKKWSGIERCFGRRRIAQKSWQRSERQISDIELGELGAVRKKYCNGKSNFPNLSTLHRTMQEFLLELYK